MIKYDYKIRIPYVHVDRMGFVYHSHYIEYFDMARNEMMRSLGLSNKQLEDEGIMLPVINVDIKYNMPAHYDDMLTVRVQLLELPGVMITFNYDVLRGEEILCTGKVRLAFMHSDTKKACRPPKKLIDLLKKCGDF